MRRASDAVDLVSDAPSSNFLPRHRHGRPRGARTCAPRFLRFDRFPAVGADRVGVKDSFPGERDDARGMPFYQRVLRARRFDPAP